MTWSSTRLVILLYHAPINCGNGEFDVVKMMKVFWSTFAKRTFRCAWTLLCILIKWCDIEAPDSYVDDIYVADKALVPKVIEQFRLFGLPCLELVDDHGDLCWTRRPDWCGRLTSHYPICDWLRPATSYLKRICCEGLGSNAAWDRPVLSDVKKCCDDVVKRLQVDDPVRGVWSPPSLSSNPTFSLYCDASSLAVGVIITVDKGDGNIVPLEDSCWLVAKRSKLHINILEL
ncbi:hypothetical protein FOZ62_012857, partial [Perkinsus olseni]